jgi:hypothetical protein
MHVLTKQIQRRLSFPSPLHLSPWVSSLAPSLAWSMTVRKQIIYGLYTRFTVVHAVSLWPGFACDRLPLKNDPMRAKFYAGMDDASKWAKANIKFRTWSGRIWTGDKCASITGAAHADFEVSEVLLPSPSPHWMCIILTNVGADSMHIRIHDYAKGK